MRAAHPHRGQPGAGADVGAGATQQHPAALSFGRSGAAGLSVPQPAGFSRSLLSRHVGLDHRAGFLRPGLGLSRTRARRQCPPRRDVLRSAGTHRPRHPVRDGGARPPPRHRRCRSNAGRAGEPDHVLSAPSRRGRCREDARLRAGVPRPHRRRRARFVRDRKSAEQVQARVSPRARRRFFSHRPCRGGRPAELCLGSARHARRRAHRSRQPLARG